MVFVLLAGAAHADKPLPTVFAQPLDRRGAHLQLAFGWGGGPTSHGLVHNMELGRTFGERGWTIAYNHVFVLSRGIDHREAGSDLFGGHMLLVKVPLFFQELVFKGAIGFGENVDMSDGFKPTFGLGWLYGVDFHIPVTYSSGFTLGLIGFHAATPDVGHQFAGGLSVGYTWF